MNFYFLAKRKRNGIRKSAPPKVNENEEMNMEPLVKIKEENPLDMDVFKSSQIVEKSLPRDYQTTTENVEQITHFNDKKHVCNECGKNFKRNRNLVIHMKYHKQPEFGCDDCGDYFFEKSSLNDHIQSSHLQTKAHKCKYCSRSYFKAYALNRHVRSIHLKQKFICWVDGCKKEFNYKHHCKLHIIRMHRHVKDKDVLSLIKQSAEVFSSSEESDDN